MKREQSIGARVSETSAETAIEAVTVRANFAEQSPDDAAHQQQRDEHGNQRQADRQHCEPYFARAFESRLERGFAAFDMAMDVFHDNNGIVDDETNCNGEGHQRKIIEAETKQIHYCGRTEQCQRYGDAGNDRRPKAAQE